jgi:chitodextrinase
MAVVLAGFASAPPKPVVEAFKPESQPPAECTVQAPSGNGAVRLGRAVGYGALGVFLGALQGASESASWSRWAGAGHQTARGSERQPAPAWAS